MSSFMIGDKGHNIVQIDGDGVSSSDFKYS